MSSFYPDKADDNTYYDVVVCGAGLAGLTLARQLRMNHPNLKIALFDQQTRPFPDSCLKVGESSVEVGTHYFADRLKLSDYFAKKHVPKLGLRFFFGDTQGPFEDRPEFGAIEFPEVPSYQIDRGIFENDMREMIVEQGAHLYEGYSVKEINLSEDDSPHQVVVKSDATGEVAINCRWVVDGTGRKRMLQRKLGLQTPNGHNASAAWFRIEGRVDVDDLVSPENEEWHDRMPTRTRFYSTNHLMGAGYWVWLIPLGSGNTSIGIVASEEMHPIKNMSNYELAYQWLQKHEPKLADYLGDQEPLDFLCYKNYSYSSHQVLSHERWTCIGEAGVFADPFYSPGSDFICMGNLMTEALITSDLQGTLTRDYAEDLNALFLAVNEGFVDLYRNSYDIWGCCHIMSAKILWDWAIYWAFFAQLCFQDILTKPGLVKQLFDMGKGYLPLNGKAQQLFRDWGRLQGNRNSFEFLNPFEVPYVLYTHIELANKRTADETIDYIEENVPMFEQWLDNLVEQATRELTPEQLESCRGQNWFSHVPGEKTNTMLSPEDQARRDRMDEEMIPVFGDLAIGKDAAVAGGSDGMMM
ncbi:MAG: NAD(P)/FAD-dependent oxidoreductase [Planctomycetaceae bacterium]